MAETLLEIVRRHTEGACARDGVASTACGLIAVRKTAATSLEHTLPRPLLCLVLQGSKRVSIGNQQLDYAAGDSMLITANQPMVSQIMQASASIPYLSLALDLDLCIIADLVLEMQAQALSVKPHEHTSTYEQVADTALRLMQLLDRPAALAMLHQQLLREIHYWLLTGMHGAAIRQLGTPDSHVHRIARSVAVLRAEYANALPAERLAAVAGMSRSSFHQHFRAVTSLTPLQFQKQLRLIEARRLIVSEGRSSSSAAFEVGYEGASHFARDYLRMFGILPGKDRLETSKPRRQE
ncbi:AraC family transcriptional regulator N-terminal domain-containing protein [Pseudomonas sp. YJ42]|jgi:AraC-like DNA-binding protein|uniref:AraC family transcriptional regulator N-terminal domain-containing protein n=1 Tax=Pseudomonas sp. YJ42 TaxID=3392115 RepID=UPI00399FBEFE